MWVILKIKGSYMKEKLLTMVRWTGVSIATISMIVVVTCTVKAFFPLVNVAENEVETPTVEFAEFAAFKNYSVENSANAEDADNKLKQEQSEFQENFFKYYKLIYTNLKEYSRYVDQSNVDERGLEEHLFKLISKYDYTLRTAYMKQLSDESKNLMAYGEESRADVTRKIIDWKSFLDWFSNDFESQLQANSLKAENSETSQHMGLSSDRLMKLGSSYVALMVFIIILYLIKIERNTRKDDLVIKTDDAEKEESVEVEEIEAKTDETQTEADITKKKDD